MVEFSKINMVGDLYVEEVNGLPEWDNSYRGRVVFNYNNDSLYYGGKTQWKLINDFSDHIYDYENPHQTDPDKIAAAWDYELENHINNAALHNSIGYYSRHHLGDCAHSICTSKSGSGWSTNTWQDIKFNTLNKQYNNSEISFDKTTGEFTLAADHVYQIIYDITVLNGYTSGLRFDRIESNVETYYPLKDYIYWPLPEYITAIRVTSGDTSQTFNYGTGKSGSNNTAVLIGSLGSRNKRNFDRWNDLTTKQQYHRNIKCLIKPSSETKIKLGGVTVEGSQEMYGLNPSITFITNKVL